MTYSIKKQKIPSVMKDLKYVRLPYLGYSSIKMKKELLKVLSNSFPQIDFKFSFINNKSIGSFFRHKEKLPDDHCSNVVYLYKCSSCYTRYVGSTARQLKTRIFEHLGQSVRTKLPLSHPSQSAPRSHAEEFNHQISQKDFSILATSGNQEDVRLLEGLYIFKYTPELNIQRDLMLNIVK